MHSAGLVVVEDVSWPVTDLRVDYADDPLGGPDRAVAGVEAAEGRLSGAWHRPHPRTVLRSAGGPVTTHRYRDRRRRRRRSPAADPALPRSLRPPRNRMGRGAFGATGRRTVVGQRVSRRRAATAASKPRSPRSIGSGDLHFALCAEYDALPGLGHACGHNLISAITVGAALALAPVVDDLGLTLTVIGTPAEEGGGGKIELLERDGFDGQHAAAMVHPGPVDVARAQPYAVSHSHIEYQGKVGARRRLSGPRHQRRRRVHHRAGGDRTAASATAVVGAGTRHDDPRRRGAQRDRRTHRRPLVCARRDTRRTGRGRAAGHALLRGGRAGVRRRAHRDTGVQAVRGIPHRRRPSRMLRAAGDRSRSALHLGTRHADGAGVHRHGQRLSDAARDSPLHRHRLVARGQPPARIRRRHRHDGGRNSDRTRRARPGRHGRRRRSQTHLGTGFLE